MSRLADFQLSLEVPWESMARLDAALGEIERASSHVRGFELWGAPGGASMLALIDFESSMDALVSFAHVEQAATTLHAQVIDLEAIEGETRRAFESRAAAMTLRVPTEADVHGAVAEFCRRVQGKLTLTFNSWDELRASWARQIVEGALWVEDQRGEPALTDVELVIEVCGDALPPQPARVLRRSPAPGHRGYWLRLNPSPLISNLVPQRSRVRRRIINGATVFEIDFNGSATLATEWQRQLKRGTWVIPCFKAPRLGTLVTLRFNLPDGEEITLDAKVTGDTTGGAEVTFCSPDPHALTLVEALVARQRLHHPRVLVVDDELIWRKSLSRAITGLGARVDVAADGHEALLKLVDTLFDLDLLILDLHMPGIDGLKLIRRVRAEGGEWGLRILLFSGVGQDDLDELRRTGIADGVFSKAEGLDGLMATVALELGLDGH